MAKKDAAQATPQVPEGYTPRLKEYYFSTVRDELQKQFNYTNVHQIPKFEKIVVNMGVGEAAQDSKVIDAAVADLTAITGQKPLVTHARKSIATSRSARAWPSAARSPSAATACGSSSIA